MSPNDVTADRAERELRASWSIAPLRPWLMAIARRELPAELRGRIEPSDVVQQALLDAWRGQSEFRGTSHAQRLAWLRVILQRAMLQNQRRLLTTQKRGMGAERVMADAVANSSIRIEQLAVGHQPRPDEVVAGDEQSLLVAAALEKLSDEQRRVIQRRHFDHRSYDEIATELGKSNEAVRMLWVRALVQLRREIQRLDPETEAQ